MAAYVESQEEEMSDQITHTSHTDTHIHAHSKLSHWYKNIYKQINYASNFKQC